MRKSAILLVSILLFARFAVVSPAKEPQPINGLSWPSGGAASANGEVLLATMLQEWTDERSSFDAGYDTFGGDTFGGDTFGGDTFGGNAYGCDSCCDSSCGGCCPSWTVAADALFLKRSDADDGKERLTLNDAIDFDTDTGWRLTARHRLRCAGDIEFSYLGFDTMGSSPAWGQGESFQITVLRPIYESDGTLHWVPETRTVDTPAKRKYSSDLDSAEISLRCPLDGCTELLAGFRWIQLDENLVDCGVSSAYHGIGTQNDLWGFQLGADSLLLQQCNGCLEWRAGVKAGIYYNHTLQRMTVPYSFSHGSDDELAFCGEVTVTGTYRLTDHLGFRFGYQMLWLAGVALANEQPPIVDLDAHFPVDAEGDVFYHGALVGIEFRR